MRVACLQINSGPLLEQNLQYTAEQLKLAQEQGVDLVLLPENFAQMPERAESLHCEVESEGLVHRFLSDQSHLNGLILIAGSVPTKVRDTELPFARCLVFGPDGAQIAHYDKVHLFDVELPNGKQYHESKSYQFGAGEADKNIRVVHTQSAELGLSICYDLRFPEFYRMLAAQGAQLLTVPAAFTYETGRAHWQTLLQARAIENQCFVIAAAQVGKHANGRTTWGHSMIIDPWGEILAIKQTGQGLLICDIDLTQLDELRKNFPALDHRRL